MQCFSCNSVNFYHIHALIIAGEHSLGLSLSAGDLLSDSVHIGGSLLGEGLSVGNGGTVLGLEVNFTNELGALQLDEAVSDALSGNESVSLSAGSESLLSTVVLSESVDSDLLSHVELIGNGGSSNVEPVWVVWTEILEASSFIVVGPLII